MLRPFAAFLRLQASSGILLMLCAVAALVWANSGFGTAYHALLSTKLTVGYGSALEISKPLLLWINDGLMAVFFLLVGLEIKRELITGELNSLKKAALPAAAALGGMAVPALIYAVFNRGLPTLPGWGIPMATDIAFSLGVLAILGKRAPLALKIFLTAVAIVDDLGAVAVIAVFYTDTIHWLLLMGSLGAWLLALAFGRAGGRHPAVFILLGVVMWVCMLKSGVHATIAGVLLAFAIPGRMLATEGDPATERWEHALHPWVSFLIMPVFALANAGVLIGGDFLSSLASPEALGIITGLVLGKPVGIFLFSWLAVRAGLAALPRGMDWKGLLGVGCLAGIGFTMSLFITELAFQDPAHLNTAKAGILAASAVAGVVGYSFIRAVPRNPAPRPG
ncbi:MAG: Na+/H+ antiporter NhaA [Verrucomicrobiaceae bacterium]|nr:MAG: Na+/H+ antiporter NhaA [Verrucomicrobiaceae bacterium]